MENNDAVVNKLSEALQASMATIYDAQFTELNRIITDAYYQGLEQGKTLAKKEIINLINFSDEK